MITDLIKVILPLIPFVSIFTLCFHILTPNSPLKSSYSIKSCSRVNVITSLLLIIILLGFSLLISGILTFFMSSPYHPDPECSSPSLEPSVIFYCKFQEINYDPFVLFFLSAPLVFFILILLVVFYQNRSKKSALSSLSINAEDYGFIQPLYEAAKNNRVLTVEMLDNTVYKGMFLYLYLDSDAKSTEKYVCFLVMEKLLDKKDGTSLVSVFCNTELYESINSSAIDEQLKCKTNSPEKSLYKDIQFSPLFEIYKNNSVIFKLSDVKTISSN